MSGLQAQQLRAAELGLRARSAGLRLEQVRQALNDERSIARTWLMRGTLHLVAAEDLRWMLALLGPLFGRVHRARHAELGLDDGLKDRGVRAIRRLLQNAGPLTRGEIVEGLGRFGIALDRKSQAPIHLIANAAWQGVCCLGPDRENGESTYVLLDDWIPRTSPSSVSTAELARRYFDAYGPASADDFAYWSGLPSSEVRIAMTGISSRLAVLGLRGTTVFLPKGRLTAMPSSKTKSLRLLPAFDTYLLGYRSRDLAVPASLQRRLQRGGGWIHPTVVVDGGVVAAWTMRKRAGRLLIEIETSAALERDHSRSIENEIRDVRRFLSMPAG